MTRLRLPLPPPFAERSHAVPTRRPVAGEWVVLLHGLARTRWSLYRLESALKAHGYGVVNRTYPSRRMNVEALAAGALPAAVGACRAGGAGTIHFVTHSMGGILLRWYLGRHRAPELGRVVMLSPPSRGSEVVDRLGRVPGFSMLNGPAGLQLGTGAGSLVHALGPVDYPVGIITGNRTVNPFLSLLIPGEDDGKVSVERARLEGMSDFLVLPHAHPFIMNSTTAIGQAIHFLQRGRFHRPAES